MLAWGWFEFKTDSLGMVCSSTIEEELPCLLSFGTAQKPLPTLGVPVAIGGDNLPSPVGIGLTDLPNIGRASGPPDPPGSGITEGC